MRTRAPDPHSPAKPKSIYRTHLPTAPHAHTITHGTPCAPNLPIAPAAKPKTIHYAEPDALESQGHAHTELSDEDSKALHLRMSLAQAKLAKMRQDAAGGSLESEKEKATREGLKTEELQEHVMFAEKKRKIAESQVNLP